MVSAVASSTLSTCSTALLVRRCIRSCIVAVGNVLLLDRWLPNRDFLKFALARRNVGFLHYFELKQLPNFLLAAPMLFVSATGILHYAKADPLRFATLGFRCTTISSVSTSRSNRGTADSRWTGSAEMQNRKAYFAGSYMSTGELVATSDNYFATNPLMLPHVYLYTFLVLIATFVMHVQVATRFLATSPFLYWWLADRIVRMAVSDGGFFGASTEAPATVKQQLAQRAKSSQLNGQLHSRSRRSQGEIKQHRESSPSPARSSSPEVLRFVGRRQIDLWELVMYYFATYTVLGCAMFSNYYPWT